MRGLRGILNAKSGGQAQNILKCQICQHLISDTLSHLSYHPECIAEKRWGIIFNCLITCCVHLDVLHNLDTDSFLMSLNICIECRGKLFELISDWGTNFSGGEWELQESFAAIKYDSCLIPLVPLILGERGWERYILGPLGNHTVTEESWEQY